MKLDARIRQPPHIAEQFAKEYLDGVFPDLLDIFEKILKFDSEDQDTSAETYALMFSSLYYALETARTCHEDDRFDVMTMLCAMLADKYAKANRKASNTTRAVTQELLIRLKNGSSPK